MFVANPSDPPQIHHEMDMFVANPSDPPQIHHEMDMFGANPSDPFPAPLRSTTRWTQGQKSGPFLHFSELGTFVL